VPERATDFVFAIFAEDFGLLGTLILLAVFESFWSGSFARPRLPRSLRRAARGGCS